MNKTSSKPLMADAGRIIDDLIGRFTNDQGFLAQRIDVETGEIANPVHNLGDLGDYAQYVYHLGQLQQRPDWCAWAAHQVNGSVAQVARDPGTRIAPFGAGVVRFSNLNGDFIWGILSYHLLSGDPAALQAGRDYLNAIERTSILRGGFVAYGGVATGPVSLKIPITNTLIHGQIAEPLLHLYEKTGNEEFLSLAIKYLSPWMPRDAGCDRYLRGRLATDPIVAFIDRRRRGPSAPEYLFAKGNAFFIAPLMILDRLRPGTHRSTIDRWLELVADHIDNDHRSLTNVDLNTILEVLLEHFNAYRTDEARALIRSIHDKLRAREDGQGLLTITVGNGRRHIDHHVDFAINLIKMSDLFADDALFRDTVAYIDRFLAAFRAPFGYYETIDIDSTARKASVNSKYPGLALKLAIAVAHRGRPGGVYGDVTIRNLLSDR
jgi:hypothetical protein